MGDYYEGYRSRKLRSLLPLFELFFKNDALHDPMITEHHVEAFRWATREEMARMHELTLKANTVLKAMFDEINLHLVDFKLED